MGKLKIDSKYIQNYKFISNNYFLFDNNKKSAINK